MDVAAAFGNTGKAEGRACAPEKKGVCGACAALWRGGVLTHWKPPGRVSPERLCVRNRSLLRLLVFPSHRSFSAYSAFPGGAGRLSVVSAVLNLRRRPSHSLSLIAASARGAVVVGVSAPASAPVSTISAVVARGLGPRPEFGNC